jgi:hypothetical protein
MEDKKFEFKYMVTDGYEAFSFYCSKEAAQKDALEEAACNGGEWDIYEVKHIGQAYTPEPSAVITWD